MTIIKSIDNQPHDSFFKKAMSNLKVATQFLETHLPSDILNKADMSTLRAEKDTFVDNALGKGLVDVLYSVKYDNSTAYFYLLIEHQTKQDQRMPLRLLKYILQIIDLHEKKHPSDKLLPFVYPMVFYAGNGPYTAPLKISELFQEPTAAVQMLTGPFQLINVSEIEDDEILKSQYSGIMEFIMKRIREKDILPFIEQVEIILQIIARENHGYLKDILWYVVNRGESSQIEKVVDIFVSGSRKENRSEIMTIAERLMEKGRFEGIQQGKNQGIELGKKEGLYEVAKNMLVINQDISFIAKVTGLSEVEISKLGETKNKN